MNRPPPTYAIDQLVRENGHEILRLPSYHPDFNAVEIIWSQLKEIIRKRNTTFRLVNFFVNLKTCESDKTFLTVSC
jgi:transposase